MWRWASSSRFRSSEELQRLADASGLELHVYHLPHGTRGWNKIEHRPIPSITQNWRGKPLVSYEAIVSSIAATTTRNGLTVRCEFDERTYPAGRKVTESELASIDFAGDELHADWHYRIGPRSRPFETLLA